MVLLKVNYNGLIYGIIDEVVRFNSQLLNFQPVDLNDFLFIYMN